MNPGSMLRVVSALLICAGLVFTATGCDDDPAAPSCELRLGDEYHEGGYDFSLVLDHDCATGQVSGTFYDDQDLAYDLDGTVDGDNFTFAAVRIRPSGSGSDTFRSSPSLEVLSGGQTLRGRLLKNGIGPAAPLSFELVTD